MGRRFRKRLHLIWTALAVWLAFGGIASAIFWNNDPTHGVTSTAGLSDRVDWFQSVYPIANTSNNTFGTTTLLDPEWAITVRHVVQNGSNYGEITAPENVYVNVSGVRYEADQIFTPDGNSEIALVHLRGGVNDTLDARNRINSGFDEAGRLVHIGGYGYRGYFGAGTNLGIGSFRRAYNIPYVAGGGQLRILADGEPQLATSGLLEGTVGSGDSGGPMWAYTGSGFDTQNATLEDWHLVGLASSGSGGSAGEIWGGSSNYTRVANYASWIGSTLDSLPAPAASTTGPWAQDSGSGLYDSGGDKLSVTGSNALPAIHASFGPNGDGYRLRSIGDSLTMSAIVDTTLSLANNELRYGMFDDAGGTIPGDVAGGTPWNGYVVGNATEGGLQGAYEKGSNGGGVGQWWSVTTPNSAQLLLPTTVATGTYDDEAGIQDTPAGRYHIELQYTRATNGLHIEWSTDEIGPDNSPNGVYSHAGNAFDASPASASWNFNQLGFLLQSGSFTGTIVVDQIDVAFTSAAALSGDYNQDGKVDAADYNLWKLAFGTRVEPGSGTDGNGDGIVDAADFIVWRDSLGATSAVGAAAHQAFSVPEASACTMLALGIVGAASIRSRRMRKNLLCASNADRRRR